MALKTKRGMDSLAEESAKSGAGGSYARYLRLKDGDTVYLRWLTDLDGIVSVEQHAAVPTKPKPDWWTFKWPEKMGCVCRYSKDEDDNPFFGDCYVCDVLKAREKGGGRKDFKPGVRGWALACLREERRDEAGTLLGYVDAKREFKREDGSTVTEKAIVIVNQAYNNFFEDVETMGRHHTTLLDRDYKITRQGEGLKTKYKIIALDPIDFRSKVEFETESGETTDDPAKARQVNGKPVGVVKRYDVRDPEIAERYKTDIDFMDEIEEQIGSDFYALFYDPRVEAPRREGRDGGSGNGNVPTPAKPASDVEPADLEAMMSRVLDSGDADSDPDAKADEKAKEPEPDAEPEPVKAAASAGPMDLDEE